MINNILIYAFIALIALFGSVVAIQHFKIAKMEVNLIQKDNAIQAYEELIKVIPFNRMVEERIGDAEDEINSTLNGYSPTIFDGAYRL